MISSRLLRAFTLGVPLAIAACGGEGLTLPPEGAAAHIEVTAGSPQEGRVGAVLATPLEVLVTDTRGRPVAGADVVFTFADGASGGEATPASASTNAEGKAATTLKLGTRAGAIGGTAEVPVEEGVTPVRVSFTLTALPADANGIALVSGNPQTGTVNSVLPEPLVVIVTDVSGNPIANVPIQWTVTGGGSVSATETLTGTDGRASVTRTLGPTAGLQSTEASSQVSLAGSPVAFTHTATAGGASGVVKVSGDNQSAQAGTALANPLVVQVLDAQSNPIPNRAVTWVVAEGAVSPETSNTDAQGHASTTWTVGSTPGAKTANAVVSGVGTATFNATATAGSVSATNSSVSASPGTINVGVTSTITVTVRDGSSNPVAGASVSVAASGTGNTITPETASSGSNGVATFTFSSSVAETKTITATAGGVTLSDQATITVQKTGSTVEINSDEPDPSTVGQAILVEVSARGSGATPTGEVVITLSGGSETCSVTLADGNGSCNLTPAAAGPDGSNNRRIITATYAGDARFSGDTDTENHRVNPVPAANNPPTAAFSPPTCTVGQPCSFDDTSTDSDGSIASRSWTFQDGVPATSSDDTPQVTFASEGSKTVTLTVTDDDGASNSVTHSVTVNPAAPTNQPPVAAFEVSCDDTRLCDFTDNSTDFDGDVEMWNWTFGDPLSGDANSSTAQHPSHTFSEPGSYVVTLTVTDDDGASDSETTTLTFP